MESNLMDQNEKSQISNLRYQFENFVDQNEKSQT